jgi:outer membrane protein TolC
LNKIATSVLLFAFGCAEHPAPEPPLPSVAPSTQPAALLQLGSAAIQPMYRELLAVDLDAVARVVMANNLDIRQARQRVEAARGKYESGIEAIFPVIAPSILYQSLDGANQNASGTLLLTHFDNLLPAVTVQWILNPGKVVYDIIASKRRLESSEQQEKAVRLESLRTAVVQYYELVLTQAQVAAARKAASEAEEALRLTLLRVNAGTALAADEMRSRAFLAGRRQDLLLAVNGFHLASLALTTTLHLDPVVTLVPGPNQIAQTTLVREDLSIDHLLGLAVQYRPDLKSARTLLAGVEADKGAAVWGGFGPQAQSSYTVGALGTEIHGKAFHPRETQRASASAGFALGLSTFGQVKTADANVRAAELDVDRELEQVRVQVVAAQQGSLTNAALIPIARQQVESAEEALRLAESNLKAGTMLLLDVLQAEDEVNTARLRYASAVVRYNQSQVNLLSALGLMNAESLLGPAIMPAASRPAPSRPATRPTTGG